MSRAESLAGIEPGSSTRGRLSEIVVAVTSRLIGSKFAVRYFFASAALLYFVGVGRVADGLLDLAGVCLVIAGYLVAVAVLHLHSHLRPESRWADDSFVILEAPALGILIAHDPSPDMPLQLLLLIDMLDHGLRFGLRQYLLDGIGFAAAIAFALVMRALYMDDGVTAGGLWVLFLAVSGSLYALRLIADRERADEQARQARDSIALTVESTGVGVWTYDFDAQRMDWDANTQRLAGMPEEATSVGFGDFLRMLKASDAERLQRLAEQAVRDGRPWEQEYEVIWPDRSEHLISSRGVVVYAEDGSPLRMHGVSWDTTHMRRDYRALVEANARIDVLRDLTAAGFWTLDPVNRTVTIDSRIAAMFGLTPQPAQRRFDDIMTAIDPRDQGAVQQAMQRCFDEDESCRVEFRIAGVAGQARTLLSAGRRVRLPGGSAQGLVVAATIDVTRERRDRQQLRTTVERLQAFSDAASVGSWRYDPARDHLETDARFEAMLGLAPGTFASNRDGLLLTIHPDDRDRVAAYIASALAQGDAVEIEYRAAWSNGSVHRLLTRGFVERDASGRATQVRGVTLDVTRFDGAVSALRSPE